MRRSLVIFDGYCYYSQLKSRKRVKQSFRDGGKSHLCGWVIFRPMHTRFSLVWMTSVFNRMNCRFCYLTFHCRIIILADARRYADGRWSITIEIQTVCQFRDTEIDEEKKGIAIVTCNCDSMLPLQNEDVSILRGVIFLLMISFCETWFNLERESGNCGYHSRSRIRQLEGPFQKLQF